MLMKRNGQKNKSVSAHCGNAGFMGFEVPSVKVLSIFCQKGRKQTLMTPKVFLSEAPKAFCDSGASLSEKKPFSAK